MSRSPLAVLTFSAALLSLTCLHARTPQPPLPEPPLPDQDGRMDVGEAFSLLPTGPDGAPPEGLPPGEENPVMPPPEAGNMDQLPDVGDVGLPADGEPIPEMPEVPGLILPNLKKQPRPVPFSPNPESGTPSPAPGAVPDLLPLAKLTRWHVSPLEARKISIEQRKPLLIFFAQMWDGPCPTVHVNNDLFSMPEFKEFAAANLVLTKLQYPVGSPPKTYTEAKLDALKRFKDYFKVNGYPTVIMIDESGRELLRIKGYRQIKDPRTNQTFSTAHVLLDRMKETIRRYEDRKRYQQMRIDNLTSQGYRVWTSRAGSTMMGKLVEAKPSQIILKDENGQWRQVHPSQLILIDAEWARRKQAGLIPDKPVMETAAASLPPPPPEAEVPTASAARAAKRSRRGILGGKPAVP